MKLKDIDEPTWARLYKEWKNSKITQKDFCEIKGFELKDFIYRREKSALIKKKSEAEKSLSDARFLKLEQVPSGISATEVKTQAPNFIELQLPHGIILRIPA